MNFGTDQVWRDAYQNHIAIPHQIFLPTRHGPLGQKGDSAGHFGIHCGREGLIEQETRRLDVDRLSAAYVAVGSERRVGGGRHRVLPAGRLGGHDGLERQGVHVKPRDATVLLSQQRVGRAHLVQDESHAGVGVGNHGDVAVLCEAEQVGQFLLVHADGVGVGQDALQQFFDQRLVDKRREFEVSENVLLRRVNHELLQCAEPCRAFARSETTKP